MRLFIRNNNTTEYELDIQNIDVPVSYSVADVKQPQSRKRSASKTITLEGTKNNMKFLQSVYSLSSADLIDPLAGFTFNPATRVEAILYDGSNVIFDGLFQVLKARYINSNYIFECVLFSDFSNIFELASNYTIQNLDWSKYNHDLDFNTILNSYDTSVLVDGVVTNNFTGGVPDGFGYIYGFQNWGFNKPNFTPQDYPRSQRTNELLLGVYVKEVFEKIFAEVDDVTTYTINLSLATEEFYKRLTIFREGGDLKEITDVEADLRAVQVQYNPERTFYYDYLQGQFTIFYQQLMNNYAGVGGAATVVKDDLNQVQPILFQRVIVSRTGYYKIDISGNLRSKITDPNVDFSNFDVVDVRVIMQITNNNGTQDYLVGRKLPFFDLQIASTAVNQDFILDKEVELFLNAGAEIKVFAEIEANFAFQVFGGLVTDINIQIGDITDAANQFNFQMTSIETEINDGDPINVGRFLPQMRCDEFLKSMFRMFNLYMSEPNETNEVTILPADEYYLTTDVADQDNWSELIDYEKEVSIQPATGIEGKNYNFKWAEENDYWNVYHRNNNNKGYGDYTYTVPTTWQRGDVEFSVGFAQTIPVQLTNGIVIPTIITQAEDLSVNTYKGRNARIFIYNGYKANSGFNIYSSDGQTILHSDANKYPSYHHTLNWDSATPDFDLNFAVPDVIYYNGNITTKNLWNEYLAKFIQEITSADSKILTANFDLRSNFIQTLIKGDGFRRLKNIAGVLYRLNEVINFTTNGQTTQCELIKIIRGDKPLTSRSVAAPTPEIDIFINRNDLGLRTNTRSRLYTSFEVVYDANDDFEKPINVSSSLFNIINGDEVVIDRVYFVFNNGTGADDLIVNTTIDFNDMLNITLNETVTDTYTETAMIGKSIKFTGQSDLLYFEFTNNPTDINEDATVTLIIEYQIMR